MAAAAMQAPFSDPPLTMALPLPEPSARRPRDRRHPRPRSEGNSDTAGGDARQATAEGGLRAIVRYRGFVLMPQADLTWLVQPERSPVRLLPFRTPASSLADVKALVDWRLDQKAG
ncbi:MAG: hypothetical protein ACO35G_09115 [Vulcanococcus sp.]